MWCLPDTAIPLYKVTSFPHIRFRLMDGMKWIPHRYPQTFGELKLAVPHTTPQPFYGPFFWDHPGEPVPEENFWTLRCKGTLTEADTSTIRLGAMPSGLTSAHLHHLPIFYRPDALPAAQPTVSKHWKLAVTLSKLCDLIASSFMRIPPCDRQMERRRESLQCYCARQSDTLWDAW